MDARVERHTGLLLIAIAAIVIAILLGAYVNRSGPLLQRGRGSPPA